MMTASEGRTLIRRLALAAAKAKSNAREAGLWDVMQLTTPTIERDIDMLLKLDLSLGPDQCGATDAANAVYLASRHPSIEGIYVLRWAPDSEGLPDMADCLVLP